MKGGTKFSTRIEDLIEKIKSYNPSSNEKEIQKAYLFASQVHEGFARRDGSEYISHPLSVAFILADLKMDDIGIIAALLHDAVEDNPVIKIETIRGLFGSEVAKIVETVTKLEKNLILEKGLSEEEARIENLKKVILSDEVRAIFLKIADRLHNLKTMDSMPREKTIAKAEEALYVFAPIANRLGLGTIKNQLEDLAFKYLYPEEYKKLVQSLNEKRQYSSNFLESISSQIKDLLKDNNIEGQVFSRIKHLYSIYRKLKKQNIDVTQVYDYMAFRVIVKNVSDCYSVLGLLHTKWNHIEERFRDFISKPKPNGYRSLHTSLIDENGQPFEVQIRTEEMHYEAEYGLAAHWKYKEGKAVKDPKTEKQIAQLRKEVTQLLQGQTTATPSSLFTLTPLYAEQIKVRTPKNDIIILPKGATPIDFAYHIHTDIGHHFFRAKVDGKLVPMNTPLKDGQTIEIETSPKAHPKPEWLEIAYTFRAKGKIRNWLNKNGRKIAIERGREIIERELRRLKLGIKEFEKSDLLREYFKEKSILNLESLYADIGNNKIEARSFLQNLFLKKEEKECVETIKPQKSSIPISLNGQSDLLFGIAKCCSPAFGDQIEGYLTKGKGIVAHRSDCPNLKKLKSLFPHKIYELNWFGQSNRNIFEVTLLINVEDRIGILSDITRTIAEENSDIISCDAKSTNHSNNKKAFIKIKLLVKSKDHLSRITKRICEINGVLRTLRSV